MRRLLLTLLALPPAVSPAYINCMAACRKCQLGEDHLDIVEVYCAMCRECRSRQRQKNLRSYRRDLDLNSEEVINVDGLAVDEAERPDRPLGNGANRAGQVGDGRGWEEMDMDGQRPMTNFLNKLRQNNVQTSAAAFTPHKLKKMRDRLQEIEIPEGCPTPPPCEYDYIGEEQDEPPSTLQSTTTSTTTTPRPTCPPVPPCKLRKTTRVNVMPCMIPPCLCVSPLCPPWTPYQQSRLSERLPSPPFTYTSETSPTTTRVPVTISSLPPTQFTLPPTTCDTFPPPMVDRGTGTDFMYVYVGVPKET